MYLEVYPDIIFILNFFVDLFLLFLLKLVNKKSSSLPRFLLAAAVGALFAVFTGIFPWMNVVIRFLLMNVVASVVMIRICFGKLMATDLLKQTIVLYLITYFVGGMINSIYHYTDFKLYIMNLGNGIAFSNFSWRFITILLLIIMPLILIILWILRWYQRNSLDTYDVDLVLFDRCVHTTGLMDSGNCLYDPIFKRPVMVMENTLVKELLTPEFYKEFEKAKSYVEGNNFDMNGWNISEEHILRLRFIPYQSIGKSGVMIGINLDKVMINTGKETICNEKVTAAISDNILSSKNKYQVILHKGLM
ncbi:MAG: sigma-E processing peptidase SpoIIGA [Clostridiales bacterium]|nr:sigma-E processing peptidase SpoIIGA [Clostridiales bacterium]